MSRAPGSSGVRIACIALAGTVGAMGMLGQRRGGALELFAAGGRQLLPMLSSLPAAITGVLIHAAWMLLWATLLAAVPRQQPGARAILVALAVAVVAFAAALVLPTAVIGPVATLTIPARVLVHAVLALSLVLGMRLTLGSDARVSRAVNTSEEHWLA